jgi:phage terminase large subunit-like protein
MWSRELAKSTFTMMLVLYLVLVKKELRNILLVSNSFDNAVRLLLPYKIVLQNNQRLINDYGIQEKLGSWTDGEFTTRNGVSFRALGAGQSPRGTRNENFRVDCILIDDIDTDEECRNPRRILEKFKWIQEALIPTVSVSGSYRIIVCGNKIAKVCIVSLVEKLADYVSKVNIRDKNGVSSWSAKNSEEDIDKILSLISYASAQKEYFNNPISEGTVFKALNYKKLMPLSAYKFLVCYTDPSFKESKKNDFKATVLVGRYKDEYHILKAFVDQTSTAKMIDWHYQVAEYVGNKTAVYYYMESNFLQDTLLGEFFKVAENEKKAVVPIKGDDRKKPDKFTRIESLLEPLNRNSKLWVNEAEASNAYMMCLEEQFLALEPGSSAHDDAPDAVEGAVWMINNKSINNIDNIQAISTSRHGSKRI